MQHIFPQIELINNNGVSVTEDCKECCRGQAITSSLLEEPKLAPS
jgi:hypothetical protein